MMTNTGFLDTHQQSVLRQLYAHTDLGCRIAFVGGYADAQRRVMVCLPDYLEEVPEDELFTVIRATHQKGVSAGHSGRALRHGDYLGSLLGEGLKRSVLGDILVRPDGADIIVLKEIADYISEHYGKAGRAYLSVEEVPLQTLLIPEVKVKEKHDTVASLRLDNLIASAFGLARSKAADAIKGGLVLINHEEVLKIDRIVEEGDELILRHRGKAVLKSVGGTSRKGRIAVEIVQYR